MNNQKFRWSQVYESSEEELVNFLNTRKIDFQSIHAEAGNDISENTPDKDITLWCAEGSLVLKTETSSVSLQPGDGLRLGAGTKYVVHPGIADCTYYLTS